MPARSIASQHVRCVRLKKHSGCGFTLIELMVVMGIMTLVMGLSAIGYISMRRGIEVRGATTSVRTTLMLARQLAITKRQKVELRFTTDAETNRMDVVVKRDGATETIKTVVLPRSVEFTEAPESIEYYPAGDARSGVANSGKEVIQIEERKEYRPEGATKNQGKSITVWLLTGITRVDDI